MRWVSVRFAFSILKFEFVSDFDIRYSDFGLWLWLETR